MSALDDLVALKAQCFAACDEPALAVRSIDPEALPKALVAHHVQKHGNDSLTAALAAGPLRLLSEDFVREVSRVAATGQDPINEAGADPEHVALLAAAENAHEPHREALEAAYARLAAE